MNILNHIDDLTEVLDKQRAKGETIGFVPTMGCLHQGHLSLIKACQKYADTCVVSIFINKTQFNDNQDFINYPKTLDADIELIKEYCDLLFIPSEKDMYPNPSEKLIPLPFSHLTTSLEAAFRPQHFNGVITIVKKLFDIVSPNIVFFGEKDYQQFFIIKTYFASSPSHKNISVVAFPTIRLENGLALSSRNVRLTNEAQEEASKIYKALKALKQTVSHLSLSSAIKTCKKSLQTISNSKLEYLAIVNNDTFEVIEAWEEAISCRVLCAIKVNDVRLIDNLKIF